jgi:hypothetical protein
MDNRQSASVILSNLLLALFLLLVQSNPLRAEPKDLGVYGNLYSIEEVDLLDYIQERARQVNPEEVEKKAKENFEQSLEVSLGVPEAKENRIRYIDPSITVSSPMYDHQGHIVAPPGKLNPLEKVNLTSTIVVIKESQIGIVPELKKTHKDLLILLTDGNLQRAAETAGQMVYKADNHILERLGAERVPSVITQERVRLKIEEIPVN